jgi:hypothetical protein
MCRARGLPISSGVPGVFHAAPNSHRPATETMLLSGPSAHQTCTLPARW